MNKAGFIKYLAEKNTITQKEANKIIDTFCEGVISTISESNEVNLTGFGAFSITQLKDRIGRNPKTGETMQIKASKLPKFKVGKMLKDAIN